MEAPRLTGKITLVQAARMYRESRAALHSAIDEAMVISCAQNGTASKSGKQYWGSVISTKIIIHAASVTRLCPDPTVAGDGYGVWDFSSIAVIARTIFEAYLLFFYIAIEPVSAEEWSARQALMNLRDCVSRQQFSRASGASEDEIRQSDPFRIQEQNKLKGNSYFQSLPEKIQRRLLQGDSFMFLTHDEVISRIRDKDDHFSRGHYRFLCAHVHTSPMSFYRMGMHDRGRGEENLHDKVYMVQAIEVVRNLIERMTKQLRELIPEVESRLPAVRAQAAEIKRLAQANGQRGARKGRR